MSDDLICDYCKEEKNQWSVVTATNDDGSFKWKICSDCLKKLFDKILLKRNNYE